MCVMKKNKTLIQNSITYAIVIGAWALMTVLSSTGHMSSLMKGLLVPICIYVILAVSLNLTVGILGELSLGHAGFMCVGAFSGAFFTNCMENVIPSVGLRFFLALILGAAVAGVFGILIGIPVLRLKGDYLAIVTLAFGEIIKNLINAMYVGRDSTGFHFSIKDTLSLGMDETGVVLIKGAQGITGTPKAATFTIGILLVLLGALLVKKITGQKYRKSFFIIELPEYKIPSLKRACISMLERGKAYIVKAGTIILVCNTAVQIMQSFNWQLQLVGEGAEGTSILASIAHPFALLFIPLGFGAWQLAAAAVTGFIAKENVVGTLAVVYGVTSLIDTEELALVGSGSEVATVMGLTKAAALAYLMFNLYTPPCFAALGAMNSEMKSGKWLLGGICLQLGTGYTVAFLVYQIGTWVTTGSLGTAFVPGLIAVLVFALIVLWRIRKSDKEFASEYSLHAAQS